MLKTKIFFSLLFLIGFSSINAQIELFNSSTTQFNDLNSLQQSIVSYHTLSQITKYEIIELNISEIKGNQDIIANLTILNDNSDGSSDDTEFSDASFYANQIVSINPENWTYYGVAEENHALMHVDYVDGVLLGNIVSDNQNFSIIPLSQNENLYLLNADAPTSVDHSCGNHTPFSPDTTTNGNNESGGTPTATNRSKCTVKVLTVYTQDVADNVTAIFGVDAAMNSITNIAISQCNSAFKNTELDDNIEIESVGVRSIAYNEESNTLRQIKDALQFNAEVLALRNSLGADIVMVLADNPNDANLGIAGTPFLDPSAAIAVVHWNSAIKKEFTYVHEIGHCFDGGHQNSGQGPNGEYNGAEIQFGFVLTKNIKSLMHSGSDDVALQFTDPNVTHDPGWLYDEEIFGGSVEDNAAAFEENACLVASHRLTPGFTVNIEPWEEGPYCKNEIIGHTWEISDQGNFTYDVKVSTDGINYGYVPGVGISYSLLSPILYIFPWGELPIGQLFVRFTTTETSTGEVNVQYFNMIIDDCEVLKEDKTQNRNLVKDINIFPNPSSGIVNIKGYEIGQIEVYNSSGQLLMSKNGFQENDQVLDLSNYSSGIYTLILQSGGKVTSHQLIIQ